MDTMLLVILAVSWWLYLAPSLIAMSRNHHHLASIMIVNIFLGWTFVGWVVSLAMAFSQVHKPTRIAVST